MSAGSRNFVDVSATSSSTVDDRPTDEELEKMFLEGVEQAVNGKYVDKFKIPGAPDDVWYEWAPATAAANAKLAAQGFKRDDALAALNPHTNTDKSNGQMIEDVACYSQKMWRHELNAKIMATAKVKRQDPRLSIAEAAREAAGLSPIGEGFSTLPRTENDGAINRTTILKGAEVVSAVNNDKL